MVCVSLFIITASGSIIAIIAGNTGNGNRRGDERNANGTPATILCIRRSEKLD